MSFTDFKEVSSNNPGTSVRYGGNDLKEIMQIFNNKVVASRRVSIKNEFLFTDHFDLKAPLSAPGNPTESNASRVYADPSDNKVKVKKTGGTILDIENINIPDTALNQITNKAKLPNSVVYNDQNNNLGDFYVDIGDIAVPANPASGTRRMFVDQATGKLSVRTSAGTTIDLEATGGGGSGDVMLNASNTYGDFDSIFRSSRVKIRNPANTQSYSLVGSAIAAARNVTLPLLTADDTLVTTAFGQTLTTKTINAANNTITNIGDAEHSTHTTSKISTLSKSLLNTAIVYNDQNNSLGAFYHDVSQISSPANPSSGVRRVYVDSSNTHLSVRTSAGGIVDLESSFFPDLQSGGSIWGTWIGGARQGDGLFCQCLTTGTITGFQGTNSNWIPMTDFATGTTIGNTAGFQGFQPTAGGFYTARNQNFRFKIKLHLDATTNRRIFIGFANLSTLPGATDTYLATAIPGFGFRYSSTTETTWRVLRNDSAGTAVNVDTTVTAAANTDTTLEIQSDEANTRIGWSVNGSAFTFYTTDIPSNITPLNYFAIIETKSAATQRFRQYYAYMTQAGA